MGVALHQYTSAPPSGFGVDIRALTWSTGDVGRFTIAYTPSMAEQLSIHFAPSPHDACV